MNTMKKLLKSVTILSIIFALASCNKKEDSELLVIPVDTDLDYSLPLSEIADDIKAIELELTDKSLISMARRVLYCDNYIIVAELRKIMLFNENGKFIRQIGSEGQGPGEFASVSDIAINIEKKLLFVVDYSGKLICYDFDGHLTKESSLSSYGSIKYMNYISNELMFISEYAENGADGFSNRSILYKATDDLQITDSVDIWKVNLPKAVFMNQPFKDFISHDGKNTYLYNSEIAPLPAPVLDTLYQVNGNQLVPNLKFDFKCGANAISGEKNIGIVNVFRSSRFVFSNYRNNIKEETFFFCYDTKTNTGYNMQDGYTDDINKTPRKVAIRPFSSNAEKFYYLYTNMDNAVNLEEPNPTLYIGTLKK